MTVKLTPQLQALAKVLELAKVLVDVGNGKDDGSIATVEQLLKDTIAAQADPFGLVKMATETLTEAEGGHVRTFLDLSSAHITWETNLALENRLLYDGDVGMGFSPMIMVKSDGEGSQVGYWMWTEYMGDHQKEQLKNHPDLVALYEYARARECDWICLDKDAGSVSDLPTYEWPEPEDE